MNSPDVRLNFIKPSDFTMIPQDPETKAALNGYGPSQDASVHEVPPDGLFSPD